MRGTYVFKQAGEIVGTSTNLITTQGRREIMRFLAGHRGTIGGAIGLGVGDTPTALTDTELVLEYERIMVEVSAPDFTRGLIIYKGTIPKLMEGSIYESCLWTNPAQIAKSTNILSFDKDYEAWSTGTWSPTGTRLGGDGLRLDAATGLEVSSVLPVFTGNLVDVGLNDTFTLAVYCADANTDLVRVRFSAADDLRYFTYENLNPVKGYNILKFKKADFVQTGALNFSEVTKATVFVKANAADAPIDPEIGEPLGYTGTRATFDRLLVKPYNAEDIGNILVSRSVAGAPIVKSPVAPMEVEYYLELGA